MGSQFCGTPRSVVSVMCIYYCATEMLLFCEQLMTKKLFSVFLFLFLILILSFFSWILDFTRYLPNLPTYSFFASLSAPNTSLKR